MDTIATVNEEIIADGITTINDVCLDANNNLCMTSGLDATMNVLKNVVRVNTGELQYNVNKGVPYFQTIFSDKSLLYLWASYLSIAIENTQNVISINNIDFEYDEAESKISYTAEILTTDGVGVLNERFV